MASGGRAVGVDQETWRLWIEAAGRALGRQARAEWFGSPPHVWLLSRPAARSFAAFARNFRPARPDAGRAILSGIYDFAGRVMTVGPWGDPWDRTSPSRGFASELHKFGWLADVMATGDVGVREALRLVMEWGRTFGRWNSFSWSGEILERRVFNLACAAGALAAQSSEAEVELLAGMLARQARHLLKTRDPLRRACERAVVAALAGACLGDQAGDMLHGSAVDRLEKLIPHTVLPDGGHVSRSPEAALELLFDLLSLDDVWAQRGMEAPPETARAIDRLMAALRFFTLPDGRLVRFQGGEESEPAYVAAARALDDSATPGPASMQAPHSGYQRLAGRNLQVVIDAGTPARGPWGVSACAQTGAIEVAFGAERLITNAGWSPRAPEAQAQRLTDGGSTAALGHESAGRLLGGWPGRVLGPRMLGGPSHVDVRRRASDAGIWLDLSHDGWLRSFGLMHARRLYLDIQGDELRGEDDFVPVRPGAPKVTPYLIHFHMPPEVEAAVARDNRSVLLRGPSQRGWWLRNDAQEVRVEPTVHFRGGRQITSRQVVLMGHIRADKGGRVRWKLASVE